MSKMKVNKGSVIKRYVIFKRGIIREKRKTLKTIPNRKKVDYCE